MSDNITNTINTQKPIQVKKVSELRNYAEFRNNEQIQLSDTGAYIMVGYPGHKHDAPHNFKVSIDDITRFAYTYIAPVFEEKINQLNNLFQSVLNSELDKLTHLYNAKFEYVLNYIKEFHADKPDISEQWSAYEPYIKQYWNKDWVDENDYKVVLPELSELQ
jgi:hypothetical protein